MVSAREQARQTVWRCEIAMNETAEKTENPFRQAPRLLLVALMLATAVVLVPTSAAGAMTSPIRVTSAGDLTVTATNSRDEITVTQEGPDRFRVQLETDHGQVTEHFAEGVTRNVTFNMRGGNDIIYFDSDVTFPGNLTIRWGSGDSLLGTWSNRAVEVKGHFTVLDGNGKTGVHLDRLAVHGRTRLSLGGGEARVSLVNHLYFGDFTIATSSTGWLEQFDIDSVTFYRRFTANGGNNADNMYVTKAWFWNMARVSLRGGDDRLQFDAHTLFDGQTNIALGSGDDSAAIKGTTATNAFSLRGDGGDDNVQLIGNNYAARSTFNGGGGTDRLWAQINTFDLEPRILGFE